MSKGNLMGMVLLGVLWLTGAVACSYSAPEEAWSVARLAGCEEPECQRIKAIPPEWQEEQLSPSQRVILKSYLDLFSDVDWWLVRRAEEPLTVERGREICRQLAPKQKRLNQALADLDEWGQYYWGLVAYDLIDVLDNWESACRSDGLL